MSKIIKDDLVLTPQTRAGCKDIWNAHMAKGARFCQHDIPFCPTTATQLPKEIITWEEAKAIYKKHISNKDYEFRHNAFVCFYIDDQKFDGIRGIWHDYKQTLKVLLHFAGTITPDFSTYQDFPYPIKIYATYRMRLMGYWLGLNGIPVINNVRWGDESTYSYCFVGIPQNSIVAIGTVGGSPREIINRDRFEKGLFKMVEILKPHTIIVYGSANYECFNKLKEQKISILSFDSQTNKYFKKRKTNQK